MSDNSFAGSGNNSIAISEPKSFDGPTGIQSDADYSMRSRKYGRSSGYLRENTEERVRVLQKRRSPFY